MEKAATTRIKIRAWHLAGPLIISNVSVALLGIVDTAVVGHLEHAYYLGAVAIGSVISTSVQDFSGYARSKYDEVPAVNGRFCAF